MYQSKSMKNSLLKSFQYIRGMHRWLKVLYACFLFIPLLLTGRSIDIQTESQLTINPSDYLILHDSANKLTINYIQKLENESFDFHLTNFKEGQTEHLWLKLSFHVDSAIQPTKWMLAIFNQRSNYLTVFCENESGNYQAIDTIGANIPFYERNIYDRFPVFEIPLKKGVNTLYIKYDSKYHLGLNTILQPYKNYINYSNKYYFIIGGFYFILLLLILYNALFYFSTRDKIYLYYIFFVATAALDCLTVDQLGFAILWSKYPSVNYFVDEYSRVLFLFALLNYTSYFLEIRKEHKLLHAFLWGLFSIYFIQQLVFSYFNISAYGLLLTELFIFSMLLSILYVAIQKLKKGIKAVRIFMIGYTSIFIGFVTLYLFYNGFISGNHFVYFVLFYGISIDTLMFSIALGARLKLEKEDKEKALELENKTNQKLIEQLQTNEQLLNKVNIELEDKVKGRTQELIQANDKLNEQAKIISNWNLQLDKENWKLNKEIKTINTSRVLVKNQSFEEVLTVFRDKNSCYQFIADLKWNAGFTCRKCAYTNAGKGPEHLSKRCTKCGTIESVTANTIFHKLKFPIEKAFYIAYVVFNQKDINMSEIAREIELNYTSCTRFKTKIEAAIHDFKKAGNKLNSWEDIILDK